VARRRRSIGWLVVAGIVVLGLVGAFFIVDSMLRTYAQNRVRQEIQAGLPEGVAGDVAVSIGGQSVIWQYLNGSLDRIELTAPRLTLGGAQASVHLIATGVPVNTSKPLGDVRGTIEMDKKAINTLVERAGVPIGSAVDLGDGRVSYTGEVTVFGMPLGYRATARADVRGGSIILRPTDAEITTGIGAFNLTGVVERVLGDKPVTICLSQYLPPGIDLTDVTVTPDRVRISLHAAGLKLDQASLSTTGSCAGS